MSPSDDIPVQPRILAIVGPTAVGKTDLALKIASRFECEVIGADSRQVYHFMDIGSAKPTPAQLASVPHHLVDVIAPDDDFSLARFLDLSKTAILDISARGKTPLLVGGTGQYVTALLENWNVPLVPPNPALRAELDDILRSQGADGLLCRLRKLDPAALVRVDSANPRRVVRAIEVAEAIGPTTNAPRKRPPWIEFTVIGLGVERAALYRRADARVERMMREGFLDEVSRLLSMGYSPDLSSMSGIGYRELAEHLLNEADLQDAIRRTKYRTHRYIRQQSNWFRSDDPRIMWFESSRMDAAAERAARWLAPDTAR